VLTHTGPAAVDLGSDHYNPQNDHQKQGNEAQNTVQANLPLGHDQHTSRGNKVAE